MSMKGFLKGVVAGSVLGAIVVAASRMKASEKKALTKTLADVQRKIASHSKRIGSLTRSAYEKIVDTAVAEYRGVKALSEKDLDDLRAELKASWKDVKKMVKR